MKKVLIVEPSNSFAQFMKYILTRLGYEVTHMVSAKEALEAVTTICPEFITSEAHMMDMNGMDLCNEIRALNFATDIPVAIVSIDGTMETKQIARNAGCIDYLTKPVTAKAIHQLMERHLPFHYKRHNIRAKMTLNAMVDDGKSKSEMRTLTIGEGGMYLCSEQPLQVGLKIDIELPLPGLLAPITLKGEVIYQTKGHCQEMPMGAGVKFIGMDQNTVTLLRHYMESYLSDFLPESPDK
jgi:CheY-like chemotaxis protein/Tfp pilus assembly protein PilZ